MPDIVPAVSSDSDRAAFMVDDPMHSEQMVVIRADRGKPIKRVNVPRVSPMQWMPAGDAVAYIQSYNGVDNIWAQPVAGGAARPDHSPLSNSGLGPESKVCKKYWKDARRSWS
jgi:hypothetical protein